MKENRIITFEEEKRNEKIKNIYSTVFIITFFTFVIRLIYFYPIRSLNESDVSDIIKIFTELICESVAVFLPFFVYGRVHGIGFKTIFKKEKKESTGSLSFLVGAGLCGLSAFFYFPLSFLFEKLTADGFIFYNIYPAAENSFSGQIFYVIAVPLVSAAVTEFSLRGIVLEHIKSSSKWFSVFAVMVLNICIYPLWSDLPMTVISSFFLSWLYIKTNSAISVFLCGFFYRLIAAVLKMISYNFNINEFYQLFMIIGAVVFIVSFIIITVKYKWSLGEKTDDMFSKKEGIKALIGNSAIYMLIFLSAVQVFYFYVKKPEDDSSNDSAQEIFQKYDEQEISYERQKSYPFTIFEKML